MAVTTADVHLKRAHGLITEVEKATDDFRRRAIQHADQLDSDGPFLQSIVGDYARSRQLKQQKSSLVSDLQLATQELDRAASIDPEAAIETADGHLGLKQLRAFAMYLSGQVEAIWGTSAKARQLYIDTTQIFDFADPHYMLGLLYEGEYKPAEALKEFEKCLELEPAGELSVSALREANAMRNYKKKFRGNWLLFVILLFFPIPILCGVLYFIAKRK